MMNLKKNLANAILFSILLLIIFPTLYVASLESTVSHPGLNFSITWSDNSFQNWGYKSNSPVNGGISNENGPLRVFMNGSASVDDIVAAQRTQDLPSELGSQEYLMVSIMASSINVAARIVVWTSPQQPHVILLKTYNDSDWHIEIVSLRFFDISGSIFMIELSMQRLQTSSSNEWVLYKQLSMADLEL